MLLGVSKLAVTTKSSNNPRLGQLPIAHSNCQGKWANIGAIASSIDIERSDKGTNFDGFASIVLSKACIYIPMDDLVDKEKERERLEKEKETLEMELKRVNGKLGNTGFVNKAPKDVVLQEMAKKQKYQDMYDKVLERLSKI